MRRKLPLSCCSLVGICGLLNHLCYQTAAFLIFEILSLSLFLHMPSHFMCNLFSTKSGFEKMDALFLPIFCQSKSFLFVLPKASCAHSHRTNLRDFHFVPAEPPLSHNTFIFFHTLSRYIPLVSSLLYHPCFLHTTLPHQTFHSAFSIFYLV